MNYWPGTNIFKSMNNAFNWKGQPSIFTRGYVMSEHQYVINAMRENNEATLGWSAGYKVKE